MNPEIYLKKIISEYKNCNFVQGFSRALLTEIEELTRASRSVAEKTTLKNSEGIQLDKNGEILVRSRPVLDGTPADDQTYKKILYAKASENISKAMADDILNMFKNLTECDKAEISDYRSDAIVLSYEGERIHPDHKKLVLDALNNCTRAGVRIIAIIRTSEDSFSFGKSFGKSFAEREI